MNQRGSDKNLIRNDSSTPSEIHLGPNTSLDLSWLPEAERKQLMVDYTKGMLDIGRKSQELHVDSNALKKTLDDFSDASRNASDNGNSVTISHTQTTSIGRTEILMGNTEKASKGRLSKSQTGEKDWTPFYVIAGIVAFVLIAIISRG